MMDPLSATESIIAILGLITKSVQIVNDIRSRFQNAPQEVCRLLADLRLLQSTLEFIKLSLDTSIYGSFSLPPSQQDSLGQSLSGAESTIRRVHDTLSVIKLKYKATTRGRLTWAVTTHRQVDELLVKLQRTQIGLSCLVGFINVHLLNQHRQETAESAAQIVSALDDLANRTLFLPDAEKPDAAPLPNRSPPNTTPQHRKGFHKSIGIAASLTHQYGFAIGLTRTDITEATSHYQFALQIKFPFLFGSKSFKLATAVRLGWPWYETFDIVGGHIRLNNVIPKNSEVILAAQEGRLEVLKILLESRRASIRDITEDSRPLLWYAVDGGSLETVEYLLANGSDATTLTGPYHTELLSRAFFHRHVGIARLLLQHKVDLDHVNGAGTTPAHHLFNPGPAVAVDAQFFDMLACHRFSNLNAKDEDGFTPLHRAAAYGTGRDVRSLLRLGADPSLRSAFKGWTPVFFATFYDNADTFRALADPLCGAGKSLSGGGARSLVTAVDVRGWTLLHVAASRSSFGVVPMLLQAGADPHCLSVPDRAGPLCEEMVDRRLTPLDLSRHRGLDDIMRLEGEMRKAGLDTTCDTEGDVFWPTEGDAMPSSCGSEGRADSQCSGRAVKVEAS